MQERWREAFAIGVAILLVCLLPASAPNAATRETVVEHRPSSRLALTAPGLSLVADDWVRVPSNTGDSEEGSPQERESDQGTAEVPVERESSSTSSDRRLVIFHCSPPGSGSHPAVILLHGAGPQGAGYDGYKSMCEALAQSGYYTELVEYYVRTGAIVPGQGHYAEDRSRYFPIWVHEIREAVTELHDNPAVGSEKVGLMGFSLGAFLALATGAAEGPRVGAIVDFYGGLESDYQSLAVNMPPTLILHGEADDVVPVQRARTLDALLTRYQRPHEMKLYPHGSHGFDGSDMDDAWGRSVTFLNEYLGG